MNKSRLQDHQRQRRPARATGRLHRRVQGRGLRLPRGRPRHRDVHHPRGEDRDPQAGGRRGAGPRRAREGRLLRRDVGARGPAARRLGAGAVRIRLLQINGSTFDQLLRDNPEIAVRMMRKLSRRLRETDELLRGSVDGHQRRRALARDAHARRSRHGRGAGAAGARPLGHGVPRSRTARRPRSAARTR